MLCSSKKFEKMALEATDICLRVLKESNKSMFDSCSRQEPCIDHIPYFLWDCRVHIFSDNLSRNSCMHIKKTVGNRKNVIMKKCDFMRALYSLVSLTVGDYIMCHLLTNIAGR